MASSFHRNRTVKMLDVERERELIGLWRYEGDVSALEELITAHEPLVLKMAHSYKGTSLPVSDLAQEAYVGLLEAARRFDCGRGVRFATYARWWIKSRLQDYALRNGSAVRAVTSSRQKSLMFALRRMRSVAGSETIPSEEDKNALAKRYNVSAAAVERMAIRISARDRSLDSSIGAGIGLTLKDMLADDRPDPETIAIETSESSTRREWLIQAIARLPDREQRIIRERHLKENGPFLRELSDEFGVSKERVRQLEKRALDKLRAMLASDRSAALSNS